MRRGDSRILQSRGVKLILVINRTFQKAAELAEAIKGRAAPFEALHDCLVESDIVISSTGSENFIVKKEDAQRAIGLRRNRPIFFIDIAVPRDIDPRINELDNTFLYDIDDLKVVVEKNRKERNKEAEKAEELVSRHGLTQLTCRWRVVELWTVSAAELLAANDVGLIPWVPLARFDDPPEVIVRQCYQRIEQQAVLVLE